MFLMIDQQIPENFLGKCGFVAGISSGIVGVGKIQRNVKVGFESTACPKHV